MERKMKRIVSLGLSLVLVFTLVGCQSKKSAEEFAQYLEKMPAYLFGNTSMDINFLLDDPEAFGIKVKQYEMPYSTNKEYKEMLKECDAKLEELESFDYKAMNKDQKITYDVLKNYLESVKEAGDDFYIATNYFDVNGGVQSQLSLNLWMYEFKSQVSLDSFIAILNDMPETLTKYVAFEQERQDKGYGMSKSYMNKVIEDTKKFNASRHDYIIEAANKRIDEADFVQDKQAYKDKIKVAYETKFLPAFVELEKQLGQVTIKTKDADASLADYKGGKEYYVTLIDGATSIDSIDDYEAFLDDQEKRIMNDLYAFAAENASYMENVSNESLQNIKYTNLTSVKEVLNFQEDKVLNGGYFPKIEPLDYEMLPVPEAMRENFQASAAYFVSPYDAKNTKERMVLNGDYSQSDYGTIAHEGFPGHMYQHNFFKTIDHNIVRDILGNGGYSEGWAVYAETKMCEYTEDPVGCEFSTINSNLTYLYILKLDKMIHYDNITREEAYRYLTKNFGISDEKDLSTQYEQLLFNPAIFVKYYGAYYLLDELEEKAMDAWGDEFTNLKFNKQVLSYGQVPLDLLEQYMNESFD